MDRKNNETNYGSEVGRVSGNPVSCSRQRMLTLRMCVYAGDGMICRLIVNLSD